MPAWVIERLACPACSHQGIRLASQGLNCTGCGAKYQLADGRIPILIAEDRPGAESQHGGTPKARQAAFFDHEADPEYEITRPHGVPLLFGSLLVGKLERGVRGLEGCLRGGTALAVCGGSGMDAEYLARCGARVVSADISLGAARRAQERARRYGLDLAPVVADAQLLPFGDRSFDLVYVHDGLHHLDDPLEAVSEMARTAEDGISINEPADATLTALAVRIGLAEHEEEAGNIVRRLQPERVAELLRSEGFDPIATERYAILYRHEAGPLYRLMSRRALSRRGIAAVQAGERLLGRVGNKLSVRALRDDGASAHRATTTHVDSNLER